MINEVFTFAANNKDAMTPLAAFGALVMTAITAFFSLLGTIYSKKIDSYIKRQESIRKLLEEAMMDIGENMHKVLASADILVKKFEIQDQKTPSLIESIKEYKTRIDISKKLLLSAKTKYRYKIYGLEDGLFIIARSADWIKGLRTNTKLAKKILYEANKISKLIDQTLIKCYREGDYPNFIVRLRIKYLAWKIRRLWEKHNHS